ncbi:MAG: hypothetical protein RBS19_10605 [Bacteroidales bacterium]|nr:hypothetical protein [Bacteroidales bacterium]
MNVSKIILLLSLQFVYGLSFCQNSTNFYNAKWDTIIETNFETKNKDTLKIILNEWAKTSSPFSKDSLESQREFIKETYTLFPKIVEILFQNFCPEISNEYKPEEIFYHLPTTIIIQFSNKELPKNLLKYQSDFSGISQDSLFKHPNAMINEVTDIHFFQDFLNPKYNVHQVILNNFRPYLKDSSFAITYDNENNYFQKTITESFSFYSIEKSLLKKGFSLSEIRETLIWAGSKITQEYVERYNHLSSYRIKVSDVIKKVVFYKDYESAVVEINSNLDRCCPTYYIIFEKENEKWVFNRFFSLDSNLNCSDGNQKCDFR